jgi:hypothetical protein
MTPSTSVLKPGIEPYRYRSFKYTRSNKVLLELDGSLQRKYMYLCVNLFDDNIKMSRLMFYNSSTQKARSVTGHHLLDTFRALS